jgi:hypothetical protein
MFLYDPRESTGSLQSASGTSANEDQVYDHHHDDNDGADRASFAAADALTAGES